MPASLRRPLLALLAACLALVLCEGLLRLTDIGRARAVSPLRVLAESMGLGVAVPDEQLLMRLKPGADFLGYYHINSRGWRGPEFDDQPPPDTLRVVAMGDSCTFGYGIDWEDTWPARLGSMLAAAFGDVLSFQVIDTGVPGYSSWQNLQQLRGDVAALRPDLVLLLPSGHNDITGAKHGRSDAEQAAWNRSLAARLAETRIARLLSRAPTEADLEVPPPGVPGLRWRVPEEQSRANLAELAAGARELGAGFLLVAPVHAAAARAATPAYERFARMTRDLARERQLPLADPALVFDQVPGDALFLDPVHPNEEGQAWIAFAVFSALVTAPDLLPPHPRRQFLAAWLAARESGLPAAPEPSFSRGAAPGFRLAWLALSGVGRDLRPAPDAPADVLRFDPLFGSELPLRRAAALSILAALASDDPDRSSTLAGQARQAAAFLVPPDPFARLLGQADPSPERIALARALMVFEAGLDLPAVPHDLRVAAAAQALADDQTERAVQLLEGARALQPDDPVVLHELASTLRQAGRQAEANGVLARLIAVAPETPAALTLRARGAWKQGRSRQAEEFLERALAARPSHADAHYLLGRLLLERHDLDGAERELAAARAFSEKLTYPDLPELLAAIAEQRVAAPGGREHRD